MTEPHGKTASLTWDDLLDRCSRLHTTRTRPMGPWPDAEPREDSQMIDVLIGDSPAQIVPTRMHEPGFYWRYIGDDVSRRSERELAVLRAACDAGLVRNNDAYQTTDDEGVS